MKLFQENLIKNLPDCYDKSKNSNLYKIMKLLEYDKEQFQSVLNDLYDSLDLDNATGYTLDLYGEMVGQSRGRTTDEQYKLLIKTKIARNRCDGSYPNIADCICTILNCEPSEIYLTDSDNDCAVSIEKIPLSVIIGADLSPSQFTMLLKTLLPAGVTLESGVYAGTFEFADSEGITSEDAGFASSEGGTTGGYFGVLSDSASDFVLPI